LAVVIAGAASSTLGFVVSLGMGRQPDPVASGAAEMVLGG